VAGRVDDVAADGSVFAYAFEHRDDVFLVGIDGLAEPLPEESAVVDSNGVAIAAELMDEFFHLLAKVVRAAGERATNCHFCRGLRMGGTHASGALATQMAIDEGDRSYKTYKAYKTYNKDGEAVYAVAIIDDEEPRHNCKSLGSKPN
jgi:hypothetical protein